MSKVFTFMLNKRIGEWTEQEDILSQAQFAYKTGYSTTDAVFVLHTVLSSSLVASNGACCGFIDFTKAFDNINRETLFQRLKQFNISAKLLKMIKNMYSKLKCQVRTSAGVPSKKPCTDPIREVVGYVWIRTDPHITGTIFARINPRGFHTCTP